MKRKSDYIKKLTTVEIPHDMQQSGELFKPFFIHKIQVVFIIGLAVDGLTLQLAQMFDLFIIALAVDGVIFI